MTEVWLHSNRRVLLLAMAPMAALGGVVWGFSRIEGVPPYLVWLAIACFGLLCLTLFVSLTRLILRPRVAYRDGRVLFFLKSGEPISVPVGVVEAFFQGEGPAHLPGASQDQTKSVNLIARLSQRETDWQQRDVKPAFGCWEDGYVTIRGTWCEPITGDVILRLNQRLVEVKQTVQEKSEE